MTDLVAEALSRPVAAAGDDKPFGQFTLAEVQARAAELSAAVGWGPTARVAGVARGWSELARTMMARDAAVVSELDGEAVVAFARKLWVLAPGGSLL